MESEIKTILCASFCGTGKTFICENSRIKAVEVEYWKYKGIEKEFIQDIKKHIGVVDIVFLQTDTESLNLIKNEGLEIILIYPQKNLRNEYLDRYIERDNPYDFIGTMMKYWDKNIDELSNRNYCKHFVLEKNQYITDIIHQII